MGDTSLAKNSSNGFWPHSFTIIDGCKPEDCLWGEWTSWSFCSGRCGGGFGKRERQRHAKIPAGCGGKQCNGNSFEEKVCRNEQPCDIFYESLENDGGNLTRNQQVLNESFLPNKSGRRLGTVYYEQIKE